ncbi:MAG: class I SAM-dependent methyltransferase [Bryobacteraceae bacterium]|nr:class I SAM-dependent methyltransferase [Bryobacteraceae bacterium]
MLDRLKDLFTGSNSGARSTPPVAASNGRIATQQDRRTSPPVPVPRQSNGLDQFFSILRDRGSLSVLDLAGASQDNISYITSMSHRLASEDFVRSMEMTFGDDPLGNQADPVLVDQFVSENLTFAPDSFDGVLAWDALQFLTPHLLQLTVDRLYEAMRPGCCLLAFFNSDEKSRELVRYHYRIADHKTLNLLPRGQAAVGQPFNNRSIEKLFHRYESVKFFLARDHLREIIVRR